MQKIPIVCRIIVYLTFQVHVLQGRRNIEPRNLPQFLQNLPSLCICDWTSKLCDHLFSWKVSMRTLKLLVYLPVSFLLNSFIGVFLLRIVRPLIVFECLFIFTLLSNCPWIIAELFTEGILILRPLINSFSFSWKIYSFSAKEVYYYWVSKFSS